MNWMETIRISLGTGSRKMDGPGISKTLEEELTKVDSLEWDIYRNSSVQEDLLIVLRWKEEPPPPWESDLALVLSRELKKYGLVEHTVWINTRHIEKEERLWAT